MGSRKPWGCQWQERMDSWNGTQLKDGWPILVFTSGLLKTHGLRSKNNSLAQPGWYIPSGGQHMSRDGGRQL